MLQAADKKPQLNSRGNGLYSGLPATTGEGTVNLPEGPKIISEGPEHTTMLVDASKGTAKNLGTTPPGRASNAEARRAGTAEAKEKLAWRNEATNHLGRLFRSFAGSGVDPTKMPQYEQAVTETMNRYDRSLPPQEVVNQVLKDLNIDLARKAAPKVEEDSFWSKIFPGSKPATPGSPTAPGAAAPGAMSAADRAKAAVNGTKKFSEGGEVLDAADRADMPTEEFGLPAQRKYPMPDKSHAANAKARATQQFNKGNLSAGQRSQIDAKANRKLHMAAGGEVPPDPTYDVWGDNGQEDSEIQKKKPFGNRTAHMAEGGAVDEQAFQDWYAGHAQKLGLNPNPDDPEHHYNYRAAFQAGVGPNDQGHWPSIYKTEGHPRMFLNGVDTRTGKPGSPTPTDSTPGKPPPGDPYARQSGISPPAIPTPVTSPMGLDSSQHRGISIPDPASQRVGADNGRPAHHAVPDPVTEHYGLAKGGAMPMKATGMGMSKKPMAMPAVGAMNPVRGYADGGATEALGHINYDMQHPKNKIIGAIGKGLGALGEGAGHAVEGLGMLADRISGPPAPKMLNPNVVSTIRQFNAAPSAPATPTPSPAAIATTIANKVGEAPADVMAWLHQTMGGGVTPATAPRYRSGGPVPGRRGVGMMRSTMRG
jgi:hypothetical protein